MPLVTVQKPTPHRTPHRWRAMALAAAFASVAAACSIDLGATSGIDDPGSCITIETSVSSEKIELMRELATDFNDSGAEVDGTCVFVRPQSKASGLGAQLLVEGWDEQSEGPRPVIWSPASAAWGAVVNQRRADVGLPAVVSDGQPFMVTPLVIAMPRPMAEALGWPDDEIGWADILALAESEDGWTDLGHPEWGEFRLGKTNPNFSTSGLSALIAQTYAAAGKTSGLSSEDLARPTVVEFGKGVESAVVHYGDTTLTFLNNWFRADQRGAALAYASAAAVEEKSVIDYNRGDPDGRLDPGEELRPPRVELVAVYPAEGTLYSDNPLFVVDESWVSPEQAAGAGLFIEFVQTAENQEKVLEFGFRPGNPAVAIGSPISAEFGVDPNQPQTLLEVPEPRVMTGLLDLWSEQRKSAQVTMLLDVSGSMGELGDVETGATKLELATQAVVNALDEFSSEDQVRVVTFTTDSEPSFDNRIVEIVPLGPMSTNEALIRQRVAGTFPQAGTPLYESVQQVFDEASAGYDPERINAVVVLTDGFNEENRSSDDNAQFSALLDSLSRGGEGVGSRPVRVFPIAYGSDADLGVLESIAEASAAAVYDASDPRSIDKVFAEVVSNF